MIDYAIRIALLFGINIILSSSLNIINGYCGLFSLGHAGFYAVGAYASAAFTTILCPEFTMAHPMLALLIASLIGMAAAGLVGLIVGVPCLRLTGDYLAIATIGFAEIIRIVLVNMDSVGASRGLVGIPELTSPLTVFLAAAATLFLLNNFIRSSYGRCVIAIREDEIASRSMGIDVVYYKTFAFILGSAFAGLAGSLFAHMQQFLSPNNFMFMTSVNVLLMIVIGGIGSLRGAVLGAFVVTALPAVLRLNEFLSKFQVLLFGLILILMMLLKPDGLMGFFQKQKKRVAA